MIPATRCLATLAVVTLITACATTPSAPTSQPTPPPSGLPTRPTSEPSPALPATAQPPHTPTTPPARTATLTEAINQVQARNAESDSWTAAVINQTIGVGGEVQTLLDGKAKIDLSEGSIVRLGPNTRFTLTELSGSDYDPITRLSLVAGELWVILNTALHSGSFDIETPVGVAAVRGSYLNVHYDQPTDSVIISCLEGLCELRNELGSVPVAAGQQASILKRGQLIDPPQPMSQEQLDRWANFVIEAAPLIEPMRQQLESWRATQAALDVTLQPGLLRTLVATLPAPPGGGLRP